MPSLLPVLDLHRVVPMLGIIRELNDMRQVRERRGQGSRTRSGAATNGRRIQVTVGVLIYTFRTDV